MRVVQNLMAAANGVPSSPTETVLVLHLDIYLSLMKCLKVFCKYKSFF